MDNIEMIEKLREKADVTYDEAKEILESLNWNMLDALIALEKEGKLKKTENSSRAGRDRNCVQQTRFFTMVIPPSESRTRSIGTLFLASESCRNYV